MLRVHVKEPKNYKKSVLKFVWLISQNFKNYSLNKKIILSRFLFNLVFVFHFYKKNKSGFNVSIFCVNIIQSVLYIWIYSICVIELIRGIFKK